MRVPLKRGPIVDYRDLLGPLDYECPLNPEHLGHWNGALPSRFPSMPQTSRVDAGLFLDEEADEVLFEVAAIGEAEFIGRRTRVPLQMGLIWPPEPSIEGPVFPIVFIPLIWLWLEDWEYERPGNVTPVERIWNPFLSGVWEMAWELGRR